MEKLIGYAVLGVVAWTVISSVTHPVSTIAGKEPVPMKPTVFHWKWKEASDGNATIEQTNRSTHEPLASFVLGDNGLWHQSATQASGGVIDTSYEPELYFGKWNLDVGPVLGVCDIPGKQPVQAGIRYSPCRLAFGTLAPDAVATNDAGGLGISLYLPERSVGPVWSRFGLGAWYMVPWDGGRPGTMLGLSASITH